MSGGGRPFDAMRAALQGISESAPDLNVPPLQLDAGRAARTGIPEVVHAEHKPAALVVASLRQLAKTNGRALASRCPAPTTAEVVAALTPAFGVTVHAEARAVVVARPGATAQPTGGRVGIIAAGTSDIPIAAEAAVMAREMGAKVEEIWDVGVAGLHRLVAPLERLVTTGVDCIVVAAGMDGALPSVVAGLVRVPVIGLPTSVGYGMGGRGVGALLAMLQSCAPGLVVVNIDNGIGAGATAALIANQVAATRGGHAGDTE